MTTLPHPFDRSRLIPKHMRAGVGKGTMRPYYALNRPDYDRVPIDTFLVRCEMGTEGRNPTVVMRVVKPNDPSKYTRDVLTADDRLLLKFWTGGMAVKSLQPVMRDSYRHMVFPGDPEFDLLEAFKTACSIRRDFNGRPMRMAPTLLYRALGVTPLLLT